MSQCHLTSCLSVIRHRFQVSPVISVISLHPGDLPVLLLLVLVSTCTSPSAPVDGRSITLSRPGRQEHPPLRDGAPILHGGLTTATPWSVATSVWKKSALQNPGNSHELPGPVVHLGTKAPAWNPVAGCRRSPVSCDGKAHAASDTGPAGT